MDPPSRKVANGWDIVIGPTYVQYYPNISMRWYLTSNMWVLSELEYLLLVDRIQNTFEIEHEALQNQYYDPAARTGIIWVPMNMRC